MPNVERALADMESGISIGGTAGITGGDAARRLAARAGTAGTRPAAVNTSPIPGGLGGGARSPNLPGQSPPPGASGQSQHEVLQNFFQSLLSSKTGDRASVPGRPGSALANSTSSSGRGGEEEGG